MADATEDNLSDPNFYKQSLANGSDSEDDDLPPDYLSLGRSTLSRDGAVGIPKRGTKDFESNATLLQSKTLAASRNAMWETLGIVRVHRGAVVERKATKKAKAPRVAELNEAVAGEEIFGVSEPFTVEEDGHPQDGRDELVTAHGGTPLGIYDARTGMTIVPKEHVRGSMFMRLGRDLSGGGVELLPEEALYALEGSKIAVRYAEIFWQSQETQTDFRAGLDDQYSNFPMSLQGAYAAYIGEQQQKGGKLTIEKYLVYAALKRLGYIVLRSPEWNGNPSSPLQDSANTEVRDETSPKWSLTLWLSSILATSLSIERETPAARSARQRFGPLVAPGIYRSYQDIFRFLSLIPSQKSLTSGPTRPVQQIEDESNPFTTHWNVYKPPGTGSRWRKSAPGEPSFRISVASARDTVLPTLAQLERLISEQKLDLPPGVGRSGGPSQDTSNGQRQNTSINATYNRLKHGIQNAIVAIVDEGIISYVRVADADFMGEKLYERSENLRGGKGGGRGGRGRGRGGRGRGRGSS